MYIYLCVCMYVFMYMGNDNGQDSSGYHRQSGRAGSVFGFDDFVSSKLNAMGERSNICLRELGAFHLREKRQDGGA